MPLVLNAYCRPRARLREMPILNSDAAGGVRVAGSHTKAAMVKFGSNARRTRGTISVREPTMRLFKERIGVAYPLTCCSYCAVAG